MSPYCYLLTFIYYSITLCCFVLNMCLNSQLQRGKKTGFLLFVELLLILPTDLAVSYPWPIPGCFTITYHFIKGLY